MGLRYTDEVVMCRIGSVCGGLNGREKGEREGGWERLDGKLGGIGRGDGERN